MLPATLVAITSPLGRRGPHVPSVPSRSGRSAPRTLAHRTPWGARKMRRSGSSKTIHDPTHQRVLRRQRGLESIWVLRNVSRAARDGTCPTGIESSSRRFDRGPKNAIFAFQPTWYKFEVCCPLVRPSQTHLRRSARTPVDRGPCGFGEGVVGSDHPGNRVPAPPGTNLRCPSHS